MAEENKQLTKELKELNKHLKELKNSGKHMIYSASPFKFGFFNFLAGIFHALGSLFGYLIIFGAVAYFLSQANLGNLMSKWVENTLQQVNWNKIMPMPEKSLQDLDQLQKQMPRDLDQEDFQQLQRQLQQ